MKVSFARSATKHRIRRADSLFVVEAAEACFEFEATDSTKDSRVLYLGDDPDGRALEVIAVRVEVDELMIIHAMPMRARFQGLYEEVSEWPPKN